MSELIGDCRQVPCPVQHLHPKTGEPPDYHFRLPNGVYEPRWRKKKPLLRPENTMYSTAEAALVLNVSVATVRSMIKQGKLQSVKVGRQIRIRGSWLQDATAPRR